MSTHVHHDAQTSPGLSLKEVGLRVPRLPLGTGMGAQVCRHHTSCMGHQRVIMKDELAERREKSYWQDGILLGDL